MARRNLSDMLLNDDDSVVAESPIPPLHVAAQPAQPTATSITREEVAPKSTGETIASGPRYLQLTRKEVRFTDDQLDALTALTRRLSKQRRGRGGERVTENTLVRVAVDLLLEKGNDLKGTTEDELRKSVGL